MWLIDPEHYIVGAKLNSDGSTIWCFVSVELKCVIVHGCIVREYERVLINSERKNERTFDAVSRKRES
jgi:hypothetical protein